jgi:GAF domain-containing protein
MDTCAVYLYDELKGFATVAHVTGQHSEIIRSKCVAPGDGVTGFALTTRSPISRLDPGLDFVGFDLPGVKYRSMAALPLFKDDVLIGALSVYSLELEQYTDDHLRMLETVTRLASDALANAMRHAKRNPTLTDPLTGLPDPLHVAAL